MHMKSVTQQRSTARTIRRAVAATAAAATVIPLSLGSIAPALAAEALSTTAATGESVAAPGDVADGTTQVEPGVVPEPTVSPEPGVVPAPEPIAVPPAAPAVPEPAAALEPVPAPTPGATAEVAPASSDASPQLAVAADGPPVTANLSRPPASGWYQTRQPIRFVAEDVGRGVRSVTVVIDGTATERAGNDVTIYVDGNGAHTVEYWATDLDGVSSAAKTLSMSIDGTAPRISTAAHPVVALGDKVALGLECWDQHSGVQACDADGLVDGFLPSDELGEHTIGLYARDRAGNETFETVNYTVDAPPVRAPELQFNIAPVPASGWYQGQVSIIVSASVSDPSDRITGVHWWSRGPVSSNGDVADESGIAFTVEDDGVTQITYTATTAKGGSARGEATVRIDSQRPEIRFTGPRSAQPGKAPKVTLGEAAELGFECTDAHSGVDFCGEELPLLASGGTLGLDTTSLGTKSVVIEAADIAGNRAKATFEYEVVAQANGGSDGGAGEHPKPRPGATPTGTGTAASYTGALAVTGSSWAPLGAVGVALVAVGGALAMLRIRPKE